MPELFREIASQSPSQAPGSYIYSVLPIAGDRLAILTSADELLFLDKSGLNSITRHHHDVPRLVSCITVCDDAESMVVCAGGDGVVAMFDVRTEGRVFQFKTGLAPLKDRAVTALTHHNHEIAVGSEVSHSEAVISIWDERKQDIRWQSSGNNDDITALQYHPSNSTLLLSGADDGLVSVFDTSVADEDDSLVQAFDHGGSVHKAGFMSDAIYALSSDQKLIIKPLNSSASNDTEDIQPVDFGDLRPIAQCDYLIDVLPNVNQAYVVAGSNLSNRRVDFIPLSVIPEVSLSADKIIRLEEAHGEEIVRSVYLDIPLETIFTAGEDGCVKAFRAAKDSAASSLQLKSATKDSKKGKGARFKPY